MKSVIIYAFATMLFSPALTRPDSRRGSSVVTTKIIDFNVFISRDAQQNIEGKGSTMEEMMNGAIVKLNESLRNYQKGSPNVVEIEFRPNYQTELPKDVNLDMCGMTVPLLGNMLNKVNLHDPYVSNLVIMNCNSKEYENAFDQMKQKSPYIVHLISLQTTKNILMFKEVEYSNFLGVISSALVQFAMDDLVKNPVTIQQVGDDDNGIEHNIYLNGETIKQVLNLQNYAIAS